MQQIQLNIPEPCHEDWQQMTPTEQGRFCNACAKQVVDFSMMTDTQVLHYFLNKKDEKICGRAYPDQLDRVITMPKEPKKRLFWYWNYITMLFLFFSKTNTSKAQVFEQAIPNSLKKEPKIDTVPRINFAGEVLKGTVGGIMISKVNTISGTIKDEDGLPVPYASINIKGGVTGTSADNKGEFIMKVNSNKEILQVSAVGYNSKEVKLNGASYYNIVFSRSERFLSGEVVVVGGMISSDGDYSPPVEPKHIAVIEVKDNATMQPVNKATVIVERKGYHDIDSATTDKKGTYKIKKIREYETYTVKIKANGYLDQELQIKGSEFDQRKITKQIFLEKAPELADYKKMPAVTINSIVMGKLTNRTTSCGTVVGETLSSLRITRTYTDTLKLIATKITGDLKVYPDPVQKGNVLNLAFKLKQTGVYNIQIITAAGSIVLQKQSTATTKQYIEQVPTGRDWSSGMYYVSIFDNKNKLISTSNFLIQ